MQLGAALDTETTGLNHATDQIIEIGVQLFSFDPVTGHIIEKGEQYSALQDPGFPLSRDIQRITGLTDEKLAGQRIDWAQVDKMLQGVDIIIAHNAGFDRAFIDRKSRVSSDKLWGCSSFQIDWRKKGFVNAKLADLCEASGITLEAHRALNDVLAMVELIGRDDKTTGNAYLAELIKTANQEVVYLWAEGRTYELRDQLKAQWFRWNPDQKVWGKVVPVDGLDMQIQLIKTMFPDVLVQTRPIALKDRFKKV